MMKQSDKLLLLIVGGILFLIVAVFIVVLRRPAPQYQAETSPESIAHNYLLALRQQDYDRAYGYLAPTLVNYPATVNDFIDDIQSNRWAFRLDNDVSLAVDSVRTSDKQATVTIQETTFYHSGLFDSSQSVETLMMRLDQTDSGWKISQADSYWFSCWNRDTTSCP